MSRWFDLAACLRAGFYTYGEQHQWNYPGYMEILRKPIGLTVPVGGLFRANNPQRRLGYAGHRGNGLRAAGDCDRLERPLRFHERSKRVSAAGGSIDSRSGKMPLLRGIPMG